MFLETALSLNSLWVIRVMAEAFANCFVTFFNVFYSHFVPRKHYQMLDYITQELPSMVAAKLPLLQHRLGIMGHSMGGHGALVAALLDSPDSGQFTLWIAMAFTFQSTATLASYSWLNVRCSLCRDLLTGEACVAKEISGTVPVSVSLFTDRASHRVALGSESFQPLSGSGAK